MARKLDAERIEQARHQSQKTDRREQEKQHIRETIERNRKGERKVTVIMPERKEYAYQEAAKVRVAAYCRVSTAEEAQAGSFEMQVQHFTSEIESNPMYEMRGCSCTERTLKRICRGIGRPYDPAEWKNPVKASLKPVPVVDYDRVRNYRDRRSMEALRRNLTIGETVQIAFEGKNKIRWAPGEIVRIYDTHVGVMVQLKTAHGNVLSLRKSYMIDDVVKWKTNLEI